MATDKTTTDKNPVFIKYHNHYETFKKTAKSIIYTENCNNICFHNLRFSEFPWTRDNRDIWLNHEMI